MIKMALVAASFVVPAEYLETGQFYNSTGDYRGEYQRQGNTTNYYNNTGDYVGQTQRQGGQIYIYNSTGDYKGSVTTKARSRYK